MLMPRPVKGHTFVDARGEFIWVVFVGCGMGFKWGLNLLATLGMEVGQGKWGMGGKGWKLCACLFQDKMARIFDNGVLRGLCYSGPETFACSRFVT